MDDNINTLSAEYQTLRAQKGHYEGHDFKPDIDAPNGKKFKVMKELESALGLPNTPAAEILQHLGKPDELTPELHNLSEPRLQTMPGPMVAGDAHSKSNNATQQPYYLVYYWRGKHDYLYFKIDPEKETVITSGWNTALV